VSAPPARTCDQCGAYRPTRRTRLRQILGKEFFIVLSLRDLHENQRNEVEMKVRCCSNACGELYVETHEVRKALERGLAF
jgi:hypothetical protein